MRPLRRLLIGLAMAHVVATAIFYGMLIDYPVDEVKWVALAYGVAFAAPMLWAAIDYAFRGVSEERKPF